MKISHSKIKRMLGLLCLLTLASCAVIPGSHIENGVLGISFEENTNVDFIPITSKLITEQRENNFHSKINSDDLKINYNDYVYKVGEGDVLNITVWDHPELTIPAGQFRSAGETGNVVHPDGSIFYPYVGKVEVSGKAVTEIRTLLTSRLKNYIENPQIDVSVAAYHSQKVFVSGAVASPSTVPITNLPLTLLDAINQCGGLSPDADLTSVVITRQASKKITYETVNILELYQNGDMTQNRLLKANDVIHVPRNDGLKVFVMGDVVKASTHRIDRSGLTLAEALNNSGGIDESSADAKGIFVMRASNSSSKIADVFQLDASRASMLILSTQFQLKPMDLVYVTSAPIARWNKVIQQLLPSFTSAYQLDRAMTE